jgi:hypothetical protein
MIFSSELRRRYFAVKGLCRTECGHHVLALAIFKNIRHLLLLVTPTDTPAAEVVQRFKSLSDIERRVRVLKSDIADLGFCQIGPVYHRLPGRIRSHA